MASYDTLIQLQAHPEWIPPRSDIRVFLGEPGGPEAAKTTVEPGNTFSPGMRTYGITWWLNIQGEKLSFFAPELAALEDLIWSYEGGMFPILHCNTHWQGIAVHHSLFQDGTESNQSEAVCGQIELTNQQNQPLVIQLFVVLRSLGPAGGPVYDLAVGTDRKSFWNKTLSFPRIGFDLLPQKIGCGVGDPSQSAQKGHIPSQLTADDPDGWCYGLAQFEVTLPPGKPWSVRFDCPIPTVGVLQKEYPGLNQTRPDQYQTRYANHLEHWRMRYSQLYLEVPDEHFRNAFFAGLGHMLTAMCGDQARIAALSYPLPWLRDSVYIIRCLDLAGLHDTARAATSYCVRNDFFGGFGAEGDAPGQGLWALVQHFRINRDLNWLAEVYPAIQRKAEWLFRMRRATKPIRLVTDTPVLPFMHYQRNAGVICAPAAEGLIMGMMDHHVAISWVNHWAICGLREASYAARQLGQISDAERYQAEAESLFQALTTYQSVHPEFYTWERTTTSLLWPTRVWEATPDLVQPGFDHWWETHRGTDEVHYQPEPYWLYFELAQAHNALLFGERDRAWWALRYRIENQDLPGLYGWREGGHGVGTENAVDGVTLIKQLRGCHRFESITPHGWSQAELWLLQRGMLVEEWQGGLLLFSGVPRQWLTPDARIIFRHFPTWYGKVDASLVVTSDGKRANLHLSGIHPGTRLQIALPDCPSIILNAHGDIDQEIILFSA